MGDLIVIYFILGGMLLGSKVLDISEIIADFIQLICEVVENKK